MPSSCQTIGSMSHMKTILDYVDSCSVCEGNYDEKYHSLITSRDGDFKDSSGTLWLCCVCVICGFGVYICM